MKKFIFIFCLIMASVGAFAQKSYINVLAGSLAGGGQTIYLSGDVPANVKRYYGSESIGFVLSKLSQEGYDVELMCNAENGRVNYLLSKNIGASSSTRSVRVDDGDVKEVARYNLQGRPVKNNEKGIQIIVYSNYTTKTIIIE